jgi:hypothetical protein
LEFAKLLVGLRPDLVSILVDEEAHVGFFEREIARVLTGRGCQAKQARQTARAWWRKLPRTVDRYLNAAVFDSVRPAVTAEILGAIECRFIRVGLLALPTRGGR